MKLHTNVVYIRFWDHAHWSGGKARPIPCEVTGVVVGEDAVSYTIAVWICDRRIDHNAELFAIVKGAIIEMRRLSVGPKIKRLKLRSEP